MIRVVIADDHSMVRGGLQQLLASTADIEVVGAAANGREAVELAGQLRPDVVLMDLQMPVMDGVEATAALTAASSDVSVVIVTSFSDRERIVGAIDAGAVGYLLKDATPDEILSGVRAAARGESPLHPRAARELLSARAETPARTNVAADRARDGGARPRSGGTLQQADRPTPRHHRAHRKGAPDLLFSEDRRA